MLFKSLLFLAGAAIAAPAASSDANTSCAPGGNFDLSKWSLQLPTGTPGNPKSISSGKLQGCKGFSSDVFYTDSTDGSLVMKVQGAPDNSDCVTTPNSKHCRTELHEATPSSWSPNAAKNRLRAQLTVPKNDGSVCIGQIHIVESISVKPVAELYIDGSGNLAMGVQTCRTCSQKRTPVGKVDPKQKFTYEIRYESNTLSVSINDGAFKQLSTYDLDAPTSYFKAGNYNQGEGPTEVHFYSIEVTH